MQGHCDESEIHQRENENEFYFISCNATCDCFALHPSFVAYTGTILVLE